eukprot:6207051-Pleurochrysis_carterae.AAC.4
MYSRVLRCFGGVHLAAQEHGLHGVPPEPSKKQRCHQLVRVEDDGLRAVDAPQRRAVDLAICDPQKCDDNGKDPRDEEVEARARQQTVRSALGSGTAHWRRGYGQTCLHKRKRDAKDCAEVHRQKQRAVERTFDVEHTVVIREHPTCQH